jgi:hypothetical protein
VNKDVNYGKLLPSSMPSTDDQFAKKRVSNFTKFRNTLGSNEEKSKGVNSTRRRLLGKLDQSTNNASSSLGRPF